MKKLFFAMTLLLSVFLVACGGGGDTGGQEVTAPTKISLATPTPMPAPPTPTAKSEPVVPEPTGESTVEPVAPTAEPEPAVTSIPEDMVDIPTGEFTMGYDGSPKVKNKPAHTVDLAAYSIDKFELTNDEFANFVKETAYVTYAEKNMSVNWKDKATADRGSHPVVYMTWNDASAYCEWASKRLPTEAEWEKAARGAEEGYLYPWGNDYPTKDAKNYGNLYETGLRDTFPVGGFAKGVSPYGLFDMAGNVREWTADYMQPYPDVAADADIAFGETNRVHRGGGWFDGIDGEVAASYNRNAGPPDVTVSDDLGFRCARDAQ